MNKPNFPTGFGQYDTNKSGGDYAPVTGAEIATMAANPTEAPKEKAQWFIASDYRASDARAHETQRNKGQFWFLTLDVDCNNLDLGDVTTALKAVVGNVAWIVYATRSSKTDNRKWRALVPLKKSIAGADFSDTQNAFFDLLEDASGGVLIADRALARTAQLMFLPNRGAHYEHHVQKQSRLELTPSHPILYHREDLRQRMAEAAKEAEAAQSKRIAERPTVGDDSPVDAFNKAHSLTDIMAQYGYVRAGQSSEWRSPFQTSKSYATKVFGNYAISLSASDTAAGLGKITGSGATYFDAFDLFVHFEHAGEFNNAVRTYGTEIRPPAVKQWTSQSEGANNQNTRPNNIGGNDFDFSHDALALGLGEFSWSRNAKFVASWNKWAFWDGKLWVVDDRLDHLTQCREYLRQRATDLMVWAEDASKKAETEQEGSGKRILTWAKGQATQLRNRATVVSVEALARSNDESRANADDFDQNLNLLGTPGGTVDLRIGALRPAQRSDMITKATAAIPAKTGTVAPHWEQFLSDTFGGDRDLIHFMQRAAGYALTGETREHKMLFLFGTGRNGKSVFLNTLTDIFADYARRASSSLFLNKANESHPTDLAGLQGARLVIGSELPKGKTWDESMIKDLTGGDRMTARYMRGDYFDFDPQLTLMIAGNNQPSFRGVDEAIRARVVLVPFTVTIPKEKRDPELPAKLIREAPVILRWAIEGAVEWHKRGLDVPASVLAASQAYFDEEDTIGQFIADEIQMEVGAISTADALHQRFNQWAEAQGLGGWTQRTLVKELRGRGFENAKTMGKRGLRGLQLRS